MSESEVPMVKIAQDHFNAVMDENKRLKIKAIADLFLIDDLVSQLEALQKEVA